MCLVVAGGIIPPEDEALLRAAGIGAVFSPKDYDLNETGGRSPVPNRQPSSAR
jgi:methylmalonyl-CoA mutase cobalamin-binding subunit